MSEFRDRLYNMKLGERICSGDGLHYAFEWEITRVPSGWIYSCAKGQGHSVFVPFSNNFELDF